MECPKDHKKLQNGGTKKAQHKQCQDPGILNFSFPKANAALYRSVVLGLERPLGMGNLRSAVGEVGDSNPGRVITDSDETRWTPWVCDHDKLIRFW